MSARKPSDWLVKHGSNVTSQSGEDGILSHIFDTVLRSQLTRKKRWCVEFGAWDGKHLSNTWNLINRAGWGGVLLETESERFERLQQRYSERDDVTCIQTLVGLEGESSLDTILKRLAPDLPRDLELLCIDIDGADYHVWDSVSVYNPTIVLIEFNPSIPNGIVFIQEPSMDIHQGCSLRALTELAQEKSYELVSVTGHNAIFVRRSLYHLFHIQDNSVEKMHYPSMGTEIFQLYDGTLKIAGCKKLLWHRIPMDENKMQVLDKEKRLFPLKPPT